MDDLVELIFSTVDHARAIMVGFFNTQLDFIFFFYGLAFILLGATCIALARGSAGGKPWGVLGFFALAHGAGEWLDLTALVVGDTPVFAVLRTALMTGSFVLLLEFARRTAIGLGLRLPGPWLYVPLLAMVAATGAIAGLNAAGIVARYTLGFAGAMGTGAVFAWLARGFSGGRRHLAIDTAPRFRALRTGCRGHRSGCRFLAGECHQLRMV
jgi:hypothetical protein